MTVKIEVTALPAGWIPAEIAHKEAETAIETQAINEMPRIMASIDKASKNRCFSVEVVFTDDSNVNGKVAQLLKELGYKLEYLRFCDVGTVYNIRW